MNAAIKILLLEHDPYDLDLIARELNKLDVKFIHKTADDKSSFEKELLEFKPDIVLSDYSFPDFNGVTAFGITKELCPDIPFIIVSGTVGEQNVVEILKTGITDYVIKDKLFLLPTRIIRALKEASEIKDRKEAVNNLIQSERRLSESQAFAHFGNWELDLVTNDSFWSDETFAILGLKPNEQKASSELFMSFIHPDDLANVKETIQKHLEAPAEFSFYSKIIRNDGVLRHIYSACKFILDKTGKPLQISGIIHDVTSAKRMEEELIASNKELKTFIYKASHDLRGPLSSIIGLTTISKMDVKDDTALKYLQMISESAKKLDATLISLVQSMSIKDMSLTFEPIDFKELIKEVFAQLQFHEGTSRLKVTKTNTLKKTYTSSKMILLSVFQNMIQNAVKYQNYNQEESYLNIDISEKNGMIELIFQDNGIGIDDQFKDKIFSMYVRGTSSVEGSGLGLYIVKTGIEKLGGKISVKSESGKGTTFTILLPLETKIVS